jgi:hypothetical protein
MDNVILYVLKSRQILSMSNRQAEGLGKKALSYKNWDQPVLALKLLTISKKKTVSVRVAQTESGLVRMPYEKEQTLSFTLPALSSTQNKDQEMEMR